MTTRPKEVKDGQKASDPDEDLDPQTQAMSRRIPKDPSVETDDQMQEAFTETRVGAVRGEGQNHPSLDEALSNSFELEPSVGSGDKMREAMTERRKVTDK